MPSCTLSASAALARRLFRPLLLAVAAAAAGAGPAAAAVVYSNDFSVDAAGFSGAGSVQTAPDGTKFLGFLTLGGMADLDLAGLDPHTAVNLTFDLYAIRSLDGNGEFCCGPDGFEVTVDGVTVLLDSTFTTWSGNSQNYPVAGSAYSSGKTGGSADAFGYGVYYGPADIYRFSFDIPSAASSIKFSFSGNTDQDWDDEGFGIDNVVVSTTAVPEPSTYALMLAGLGLGGLMVRRRSRR